MTRPKPKACPKCQTADYIGIWKYDNGWCHVECEKCNYLGPGEGSMIQAVKSYNLAVEVRKI